MPFYYNECKIYKKIEMLYNQWPFKHALFYFPEVTLCTESKASILVSVLVTRVNNIALLISNE